MLTQISWWNLKDSSENRQVNIFSLFKMFAFEHWCRNIIYLPSTYHQYNLKVFQQRWGFQTKMDFNKKKRLYIFEISMSNIQVGGYPFSLVLSATFLCANNGDGYQVSLALDFNAKYFLFYFVGGSCIAIWATLPPSTIRKPLPLAWQTSRPCPVRMTVVYLFRCLKVPIDSLWERSPGVSLFFMNTLNWFCWRKLKKGAMLMLSSFCHSTRNVTFYVWSWYKSTNPTNESWW